MTVDALSFLQSVAGFTQAQTAGNSENRPFKLGTIDPTYTGSTFPGTMPKVTFDGESTLSGRLYVATGPYRPTANDRVVLAPVGNTYVILGSVSAITSTYVAGDSTHAAGSIMTWGSDINLFRAGANILKTDDSFHVGTDLTVVGLMHWGSAAAVSNRQVAAQNVASTAYVLGVVNCGVSFVAPPSGAVTVHWVVEATNTTAGFNLNSFEVRTGGTVGSGTVVQAASDDITIRVDGANGTWRFGASEDVTALTSGATYNIRHMHRASAGTLVVSRRYISVEPRLT